MNQIQSFNSADMAKDIVQNLAGRQKGTEQTGIFKAGQNPQGMMDFKGLLQGRQQSFDMTKEQEQTAAMAVSGMAVVAGLVLPQAADAAVQTEEKGLSVMPDVLTNVPETMMAVKMQTVGTVETPETLGEEKPDEGHVPAVFSEMEEAEPAETMIVKDIGKEDRTEAKQQENGQTETVLKMSKSEANGPEMMQENMQTLNWQETMLKQQDILTQPAVKTTAQTVAQETVKVETPLEIPQSVAQKTVEKVSVGIQEFEIQIEPENLGKIAVKVEYSDGQATISLVCSETKTLELLKAHADDIGAVMEKNLRQETIVYVDEKRAETFAQHPGDDSGSERRESEWERHREERRRRMGSGNRFLQELRLGLLE